jgi:hypothetical protein
MITNSTDTLPFHSTEQDNMFINMAGRRFKFMFEDVGNKADIQGILDMDKSYRAAKAALMNLIRGKASSRYYASNYV